MAASGVACKNIISLKAMCAKWWLERVQFLIRRDTSKSNIFSLQRFLSDLPRDLRSYILHNSLKAGGLHLAHGSKEIPSVNRALVFLSSDIVVSEMIYITLTRGGSQGDWSPEIELLIRHGEGVSKIFISLPVVFSNSVKRTLADLCRTCSHLSKVTINEANDEVLALITRYCRNLTELDVSKSAGVTDEGVSRMIVNLKWSDNKNPEIKLIDVGSTSVTNDGVMNLITRLPSVTSFGSTDIIDVIEDIVSLMDDKKLTTSIEEITLKCVTVGRILSLKKYCPRLRSIKATFQENPGASLNDLRLIPNLSQVDIIVREPFLLTQSNLYDFAWDIGVKLQSLKLSGDVYWETDFGALVGQCPYIRQLSLPAVTFPTKESLQVLKAENSVTLNHLVELEIDCMAGVCPKAWAKDFNLIRRGLVLVMQRCFRLKRLVFRPSSLVDTDFTDIFSKNKLHCLEILELYNSTLSFGCAKLIVDTCVNLHVMKGLKTWRGITLNDLICLRKYSRGHRRASDLKIIP